MEDPQIRLWMETARRQMSVGQLGGAVESLRGVLTLDPDYADAHALLAACLLDQRRLSAAEYEAGRALAAEPESALALSVSVRTLIARRKFKEAERQLEILREAQPHSDFVWRTLAEIYGFTRRKDEQLRALEKALELDPEEPETLADLGRWHLNHGDLDRAERLAREALELSPEHEEALVLMGHALLRRGDVQAARDHAVWALRNDPGSRMALHLLASIKARTNFFLGLWWRWSTWMGGLGDGRAILVLLAAYVIYRVSVLAVGDHGNADLAGLISMLWYAFVAYTWISPALFRRSLQKELAEIRLDRSF
jgi:Flp pilus assembly protein TadD